MFALKQKGSLATVKNWLPPQGHYELTRSAAANDYVWKEDTRIGDRFEMGTLKLNRNRKDDWDLVRINAKTGNVEDIPSDIYIRYYNQITAIGNRFVQPTAIERKCTVFWGPTGTGKSHRAWELAGPNAYSKDPRTKFWCGYSNQTTVVIDEFRGGIDIAHMLRWLDKYAVRVEIKGSSVPLMATQFYITSNLRPTEWYTDVDEETQRALNRRLEVIHMADAFEELMNNRQ